MLWGEYNYDEDIAAQRQEAFDEGIQQGISQGRTEGSQQKAIDTAKALLNENITLDIITRTTGLPKETIEQLAKEIEVDKMSV